MSATAATPESSSAPAAAPTPAPAADPAVTALDAQLAEFARDWLGIELGTEERARVRGAIAMLEAQQRMQASQAAQAAAPRRPAGSVIDLDRQRIQNLIDQNLSRTQATVLGNARAERAAETAVLGAVERAQSLDDLRPPKPAGTNGAANQAPRTDPLIAQIADQLTGLIKHEVDVCFQQQFGPLASQLQAVIDAAQDSGLLARKSDSASSDESRGSAENSGKTAEKTDQNNNHNTAAKAPASASQRD